MAREPLRKYQTELSRYGLGLGGIGSPSKARFDAPLKSGSIKRSLKSGIGSAGPLRTVFAEEGPASGGFSMERELYQDDPLAGLTREESVDLLKSMGIDMGNPTLAFQSIVERAKRRPESVLPDIPSDVGNISELAKAYAKVVETARPETSSTLPSVEDILSADPSVFNVEGPEITKLKKESERSLGISGPKADELARAEEKRKKDAEDFRAEEAKIADMQGMRSERVSLKDIIEPEKKDVAVEDAFLGGMSEYYKALAQDVPEISDRKELLQKYMQEFSEATGIPVEGKIDKSQALMALGLGLMQNRAGKRFNVGRMLSSVGEAGQAAMPYLTKAKDDAKQARIAAGKYALEKIKSDEDASQAIETSNAALRQELILKNIDAQNDAKMKILEAQLEGKDVSQMPESIYNEEIKIGTNTYKVRMGINPSNLQPVFVNPTMDADEIGTAYSKTISGLNTINEMEQLTNELIDLSRETPVGMTGRRFLDSAKGVMRSMGMSEEDFFRSKEGKGLSAEDELDAIRRAFIMRFKRFISQETGNGISNVDVAQIEAASGALDELLSFKNPEKSLVAFKELRKLFDGSLASLQPMVTNFTDRDNYYAGEAGDKLYEKTMEKLNQSLGGSANFFTPTMVQNEDGSQTQTYDVRN